MAIDISSFAGGMSSAAQGFQGMMDGAQRRLLVEEQNKRANDQNQRAEDQEGRASELSVYEKSLRERNEAEFTNQADRAAQGEVRAQNQEGRTEELSKYTIGQRPVLEKRAEATEQRAVNTDVRMNNQDSRYQQTSDFEAQKEGERRIQNYNEQLLGQLATTESYGLGDPTTINDPVALAQERPELVRDMLDRHKKYQFAVINGERVEIDVIGFNVTDTAVIPRIANAETGEELTPTVGGTDADTDTVLMQSHKDFSKLLNNELVSALNNGGDKSSVYQSSLVRSGGLTAAQEQKRKEQKLRDTLIAQNTSKYANSPEATRAYLGIVNNASMEDLLEIYRDQGGDPAALEQEQTTAKDAERSQLDRTINPSGERAVGPAIRQAMARRGMTNPGEWDLKGEIESSTSDIRSAGGKSGFMDDQTEEDYKLNTAAEKWYDDNTNDLAKKMFTNPAIKQKFDELGPADFFRQYGVDTDGGQVDPKNMLSSIQPPPFELTRDSVIEAITDQAKQPTQQQRMDMVQFLKDRGIVTDEKFREGIADGTLPSDEALAAIWTAASFSPGTPAERVARAQELTNLAARGDTKVGVSQQNTMDEKVLSREATTSNARITAAAKVDAAELTEAKSGSEAYFNTYQAAIAGKEPSPELSTTVSRTLPGVMRKLKQSKSIEAKREYLSAINPALSTILQGNAVKEGIWDKFTGLFSDDVDLGQVSDFNLEFVRMGDDNSIVYAPPGGQAGKPVPLSLLMDTDANVAKLLTLAAQINGG